MWSPTHVQVVVHRARNLAIKGKHGTNDAFVTIQLGKEKYQTSVKEKSSNPEWNEECELTIPDGNTSCINLTVLHRNFVGLDKFLGQISIPLNELFTNVYERSKSRWYHLEAKAKKVNTKERGELEVRITFAVKSVAGSLVDLSKKEKKTNSLPLKMVQTVGGSLMNLAGKDKKLTSHLPFKTLANYGHKISDKFPKRKSSKTKDEFGVQEHDSSAQNTPERGSMCDSDDEQYETPIPEQPEVTKVVEKDKKNADLRRHTIQSVTLEQMSDDIFEETPPKVEESNVTTSTPSQPTQPPPPLPSARHKPAPKPPVSTVVTTNKPDVVQDGHRKLAVGHSKLLSALPKEKLNMFEKMSKEDLVELVLCQQTSIDRHLKQVRDLEDYIDDLLVRVMETTPRLLQNPFKLSPSVRKFVSSA